MAASTELTSEDCGTGPSTHAPPSRENSVSSFAVTEYEDDWYNPAPMSPHPLLGATPTGTVLSNEGEQNLLSQFRVVYQGGLEIRSGPFYAPQTGLFLQPDESFSVSQEIQGEDGIVYLCLADGRGWVFDDSKLMPQDPSVVRCSHSPVPSSTAALTLASTTPCATAPSSTHFAILASTPPVDNCRYDVSSPSEPFSTVAGAWYQVTHPGGIQLLNAPCSTAGYTGASLGHNETFQVAEEVQASDGLVYLRLLDGRGWAFLGATKSQWPCVVRGRWLFCNATGAMNWVADVTLPRQRRHPQPRGKRGGKRVSKRKNTQEVGAATTVSK